MIRNTIVSLLFLFPIFLFSQTGPGGVGSTSDNGLWLKADAITGLANGDPVVTWLDRSGNNNHATNMLVNEQPEFRSSSSINGKPSVLFDGVLDQMIVADADILDGSVGITYYAVIRPHNLDQQARGILGKRVSYESPSDNPYTFYFWTSNQLFLNIDGATERFSTAPFSNGQNLMVGFDFDGTRPIATRSRIYNAGNLRAQHSSSSTSIPDSPQNLVLGALNKDYIAGGGPKRLGADYAEVIHYNRVLNTAERKIVENYLGAKYGIAIAYDLYSHQAVYAGEVAGIGQDNSTNSHSDAQGAAIVRINSPSNLSDGDFMLWGHNESSIDVYDALDVDGTTIKSRMSRVWAVDKTNDLGTVNVTFDLSVFSPITPGDVRLLIDRNGKVLLTMM